MGNTAPPFWVWMASQHLNTDPQRAAAAKVIRDRFGFNEYYNHARVLRRLAGEESEFLHGAQLLADDYANQFEVLPKDQVSQYGSISPLVPVTREQCSHASRRGQSCSRDAVPGTGKCGYHGGQWITEAERAEVVREVSGRLVDLSDRAVRVLAELLDSARSEKVRFDAAVAILDRIGVGPSSKVEIEVTNDAENAARKVMERLEQLNRDQALPVLNGEVVEPVAIERRES